MNIITKIREEKKVNYRNISVDIAKGIGIILVILAHIILNNKIVQIIYFFHMPLFFWLYVNSWGGNS